MRHLIFFSTILLTFARCTDKYPDEFYGTYSINDSFKIRFSKLTFYHDNVYSFYGHTCLSGNRDSGEYKLIHDTLIFKSFNVNRADIDSFLKPLTGFKFVYREDTIAYFNKTIFPDKSIQIDTTFWTKDKGGRKPTRH